MRLIGEEEAKRRGLDRLFYGSDPMVMEDPVSIMPGDVVREREEGLRSAFNAAAASGITPERAGEDLRLSRSTGIPFGMISESERMRNSALLDEHRRACREAFARAAREAPAASSFLSKPENMLFARNDVDALTETERWFEVPLRSLKANSLDTRINALYGKAALSGMNESIENEITRLTAERQALGDIPEGAVNNYLWNAFSMLPQLWEQGKRGVKTGLLWGAGGVAAAALFGQAGPQAALPEEVFSVPAAFGIMGTQGVFYGMAEEGFYQEAGAAYNEYRQIPNVDDDSARLMAVLTGGVNALIERASLGTLAKTFPGGSAAVQRMLGRKAIREALSNPTTREAIAEFAKTYAKGISIDTVQEVTQEFVNIVGGDILKSRAGEATSSVEDIASRLGETAVQSVMAESLIYLPGPALGLRNNLRRARNASMTAESFAKAAEVMDRTEVKNLAPSVAERYVREAIAGTGRETSYVPASKVVELYQSSDLEELRETFPEVLGVTEAESIKAMEDGIDIEIDSAKLLNADKSLRDAVLPFVSFEPEGMSQADAERLAKWSEKSVEKGVETANFEMERERRYIESARKVAESKRMELEAVGRDPETAAAEAELAGNMYVTLARRWNEAMPRKDGREYLPEDIAKMYPITLTRSEDGSGKVTGLTLQQAARRGSKLRADGDKTYYPPANADVDSEARVKVVDLSDEASRNGSMESPHKIVGLYDAGEDKNARLSAAPDNELADLPGLSPITIREVLSGVKDGTGIDYSSLSEMSEDTKKAMPDKVLNSFGEARAYLREQIKKAEKGVENESDGIAVSLAANGIKKMLSGKASDKSLANGFTLRDHITAAANILKLYKNSELLFTHEDEKQRPNVTQIKRFGAPVVVPDSQDAAIAYITVREVRGEDNKLYSVELVSFELLKAERMPPGNFRASPVREMTQHAGGTFNVTESPQNVNAERTAAEKMPPGTLRTSLTNEEIAQPTGGTSNVAESVENVNAGDAEAEKMPPGTLGLSHTDGEIEPPTGGIANVSESTENVNADAAEAPAHGETHTEPSDGFTRLSEKYEKVNEELKQFYQKASANIRGSITFPSRRGQPVRITFSPSANRSTFMHEMAHFYLYQLRQMEAVNDGGNYTAWNYSPPSWINDLRTISSWWNENAGEICEWIRKEGFSDEVKGGADAEAFQSWLVSGMETDSEIGRAFDRSAHEYFARGFERYLEEGRAPTAALQKVFRRFKRWLTEIYRDFIGLNVELNDDVRGVFDRMVATEDAIEVFRAERDIEAAFGRDVTEEEALNISPFSDDDEFAEANERLLSGLLEEVSPEARKRMTDYAEKIRPGIVRAVANSRPYRVLSILEDAPEMRINEQSFVDAAGDTAAASMPDGLLTKEGGLDLGYGLKNLDYPSVDELLSDFSGLSDFKTAVDARVYNEVARRFVSAASSEDGIREAVNRAWYEGTEHAERIAAEASIDDFADIYAADEAARAAAESPTNRAKVADFVKSHGFIKYESVVQEFGREQAQALHKRAPFLFRTGGFGLDELAQEMRGNGIPVESDEHLFNILLGPDAPRSPIDTAHEQGYAEGRASVLYGYGKSEDEARSRRRALDRALKDSVGKEKTRQKMESAKMAAENIVRAMTVEDLRKVVPFVRAEKNARMNAESALRRGDEAGFRDWKEKELLNNSVVRQMYKSQREAEIIRTWLERYKNRTQKQTFGMDVKFLKQVDAMLSRVGLRRIRSLTEAQRKATIDAEPLTKFLADMAEEGTPIMVPDWIAESNAERHYSQLMLWQLKDIRDTVKNIVTAGRQEKRLISLAQNIAFTDAEDEIITGSKKFYGDKVSGESSRMRVENTEKESRFKLAKDYLDDLFTPEAICRAIDGYEEGGAMQRYVFRPVREGQSRVCLELNETFAKFRKLKEDCYGNKKFSNDKAELDVPVYERLADKERPGHYIYIPTNEKQRFTRENLVCFGLNLGNEGNIARLKNSGFTDRDINFIKNKLTAEDWKYIQGVWDLLETMWPKIQKVHELMTGTTVEPVKAQPVVTKYGTFRGGYYPIVTDLRYSLSAAAQSEVREVMTSTPMRFANVQTESGHRKARAENVEGRPLLLELSVLDNHVANVVYDYEMTPVIRDVRKLLKRDRIQRLIDDVLDHRQADNLHKWLNDVAANTKNNGLSMDTKDRLVNKAISGTAMFSLGANVGGALMQPLGYFPLAHRIGGVNAALAVLKGLRHPEETWRLAHEKSAFMREQMDGTNTEVRNLRQNWSSQGKKLNAVQDRMLAIYPFFQNMCSVPGWCQSYYVGMKKFNGDEKEAIAYADAVIRQTQGASGIADLSTFERGGVVARFFSMFYSWFRVQYQMQTEAIRKAYYGRGLKGRMGDLASYVFYVLVAQSVAEGLIRGDLPDDDDDPFLVRWAKWTAKRATVSTLSTLPMVRDATSFVDNNFGYRVSPAASAFESVYRLGESAKKFLTDPDDEWTDAVDLLEPAATVAGYYYGVPNRKMIQAAKAFWGYFVEEEAIPWAYLILGGGYKPKGE